MAKRAIETRALRRVYTTQSGLFKTTTTEREALRGIDLSVEPGELFGLLGPNGAGKTTLVKILSTILLPTAGEAWVLGHDLLREVSQIRQKIGVVFGGDRGLHPRLTARQTLLYWAALFNVDRTIAERRIPELLDLVGLTDRANERVENYSRGMKQRLHLARGLIHHPQVLFLDEPTIGLDPVASLSVREVVKGLQQQNMTILLTTHNMQEAEELCNRVAFIIEGNIVLLDSPKALARAAATSIDLEAEVPVNCAGEIDQLRLLPALYDFQVQDNGASRTVRIQLSDIQALSSALRVLSDLKATRVLTKEPSLEDVYLRLFGDRKMEV